MRDVGGIEVELEFERVAQAIPSRGGAQVVKCLSVVMPVYNSYLWCCAARVGSGMCIMAILYFACETIHESVYSKRWLQHPISIDRWGGGASYGLGVDG